MQILEENSAIRGAGLPADSSAAAEGIRPEEGAYCRTTQRIAVISPRPVALHPLVRELSERCYDVLLFHHADEQMLGLIRADLLIVDLTAGAVPAERDGSLQGGNSRILTLVGSQAELALRTDEAVVWPGPLAQVMLRIESLASARGPEEGPVAGEIRFKDMVVDFKRMTVVRSGRRIDLTKTEFELLAVLLEEDGGVLSRQRMMDLVWGDHYYGGSNTVDAHIKSLRQKLGDDPRNPEFIATVRGVGYRLAD